MATDQERAEELLHFISNEPRHGDAIAAIVKEFENVRAATLAAYVRAHVPFKHDTDGPSAIEALVTGVFNDEIEKHRRNIAAQIQHLGKLGTPPTAGYLELVESVSFLLALAHQPTPGGVVEIGGSSPAHEYERCMATCEGEPCQLVAHLGSPHQTASGQRWETGSFGLPRKL